jgi:hypothetical protein
VSRHLDAVLDDLRVGLRRRAARRRMRAAATGGATVVLLVAALAGMQLDRGGPVLADAVGGTDAAQLLEGCSDRTQLACFDPLARQ